MAVRRILPGVALAALVLAGCGGGGGGTTATNSTGSSSLPLAGAPSAGGTAAGAGTTTGGTETAGSPAPTARSAAFQVNTTDAGVQNSPSAATLADGGYVVAWHTDDAQANAIFVRRFAADGTPAGAEARIDDPVAGRFVSVAKVAGLEGGGYAVAWQSRTSDFDRWSVHVRHVRADGSLSAVSEQVVRWFQTYDVASLASGGYALLLQGPTNDAASDQQVRMLRYSSGDTLLDTQLVEMGNVLQQSVKAVVMADGRRLVSWLRNDVPRGTIGLFFRFMAADGTLDPVGHVGGAVSGAFADYVPAALRDGGFVIAGTEFTEGTNQAVYVQRFAPDGTAVGSRIRVDDEADVAMLGTSCTTSDKGGIHPCPFPWQSNAAVAATSDGGFVVAWDTGDRQRPGRFVYARKFDAQGNATGAPSRTGSGGDPESMPVARSVGEGFVISWIGRDADQSGIFARHYGSGVLQ